SNNRNILKVIRKVVDNGNTVIVVEHDAQTILSADWIIDIGPKAGINGGEVLFNGSAEKFLKSKYKSLTKDYLSGEKQIKLNFKQKEKKFFSLKNAEINNLKNINVDFYYNNLNCVTGVSGAGKSSLINQTLIPLINDEYFKQINAKGNPQLLNYNFTKAIIVNQSPIGKTVRSTPATYTKLHDLIRDFYAKLEQSKKLGFSKSTFSYNVKGGRCEKCQGAGKLEIGMHFLGKVETTCDVCNGKRYNSDILEVKYKNKNISDILDMSVNEALNFFIGESKISKILQILSDIGLGYLQLGQSSNTLSGGEAQRIKLATELAKSSQTNTLFIFSEPTTALHFYDIQVLMNVFEKLLQKGNTIILIEHNEDVIKNSHHIIDLGPKSGNKGGELNFSACFNDFLKSSKSLTANFLKQKIQAVSFEKTIDKSKKNIILKGVSTNNLKNIDVEIPYNKHTVITGRSGSGKSSLAFDTIFVEAQNRFTESFPAYIRQFVTQNSKAKFNEISGLTPVVALKQNNKITDPRSTLGTITEIYNHYRLLFSRFGVAFCPICGNKINTNKCEKCNTTFVDTKKASSYSFNNSEGVCENCSGIGTVLTSDINLLVDDFEKSFFDGAFKKHKSLNFYADINGQYLATLKEVGKKYNFDYTLPISELSQEAINLALFGSGKNEYNVEWKFKRNKREGTHKFRGKWLGFINLILDEYYQKHANGKGANLLQFLKETTCTKCNGQKFKQEILSVKFNEKNIAELSEMSVSASLQFFKTFINKNGVEINTESKNQLFTNIISKLEALQKFGLNYLSINRKTTTLSGGELQRVLLSTVLNGSLIGITYILDEPTTGLHASDVQYLIENINQLVENGNTIITVEHNTEIIKTADNIIEIGPKAGIDGGEIISTGISNILKIEKEFLEYYKQNKGNTVVKNENKLEIIAAKANNLKNIDVEIELNKTTVITGVSGSGKTTLMRDVLYKSFKNKKAFNCDNIKIVNHNSESLSANNSSLNNLAFQNRIIWIDKSGIDKKAQSTTATFIGVFDEIRKIFASSKQAKENNFKATDFSFNNKTGQCPECKGLGEIKVSLDFISDISSVCESCGGKRYKKEILQVKYKGKSISDILEMTTAEAYDFFAMDKNLTSIFKVMLNLGLAYLKLGQSTNNLSGGEAQRLKLTKEILNNKKTKNTHSIYIFDEPSKGLQINDLHYLTDTFKYLQKLGNTVIFIEHNPYLILTADNIIDLGHGGGEIGGELIYQGNLQGIFSISDSKTGVYLKSLLIC
ncbi:MAG: ATP-binding cassette domain-containing protein, partial [Bacteroidota bacterium]|nr:ATP-binding cassette domain-containing protein [Bacteroidota bacterium]